MSVPWRDALAQALARLEAAADIEVGLDVRTRGAMSDAEAVSRAGEAQAAYQAASAAFLSLMNQCAPGGRAHALLVQGVRFSMARIEALTELLTNAGSISRRVSYTAEQLQRQRERARLSQPTSSDEAKRSRVALEILETERSYIRALEALQTHYVEPLTMGAIPILGPQDKKEIFGNVGQILELARSFAHELEERIKDWSPSSGLGDKFLLFAKFFNLYMVYMGTYEKGSQRAGDLLRNDPTAKLVAERAAQAGCQDIGSLMITPVQRLPRYVLLLKELRKRTADDHPDAKTIEAALAEVQVVADHVNETLNRNDDNSRLLEIQSSLWTTKRGGVPVTLLAPGRRLLREGALLKVRSTGMLREVKVFLFTDILLYCTSSKFLPGRYHYHNHLEYYGAAPGEDAGRAQGARHDNLRWAFKVTSAQAVRVFIPSSEAERDEWMRVINESAADKRDLDTRRNSRRLSSRAT